jgi:hypothetical protein
MTSSGDHTPTRSAALQLAAFLSACVDATDHSHSPALKMWDAVYSGPTETTAAEQLAGTLMVSQWLLLQLATATGRSQAALLADLNQFLTMKDDIWD